MDGVRMALAWYERHVLPHLINVACGTGPILKQRAKVIPQATGRVLEVGIGTGRNVPFYDRSKVEVVLGGDPSMHMHFLHPKRLEHPGLNLQFLSLDAHHLPVPDASMDAVVCTYTLCSVGRPVEALLEMRRVLRPGGKLLFSEHGKAPTESIQAWQTRLQPMWGALAGGCQMGLDIPGLLREAGFSAQVQAAYIPGPKVLSFTYWGEAVAQP